MPDEMRFHLDENVSRKIANALWDQGIDVTTSNDANLLAISDETQFDYARRSGRVLVAHDTDFLRITSKIFDHPGVLFAKFGRCTIGQIVLDTLALYLRFTAEEMKGRVEYL